MVVYVIGSIIETFKYRMDKEAFPDISGIFPTNANAMQKEKIPH